MKDIEFVLAKTKEQAEKGREGNYRNSIIPVSDILAIISHTEAETERADEAQRLVDCVNKYTPGLIDATTSVDTLRAKLSAAKAALDELSVKLDTAGDHNAAFQVQEISFTIQ